MAVGDTRVRPHVDCRGSPYHVSGLEHPRYRWEVCIRATYRRLLALVLVSSSLVYASACLAPMTTDEPTLPKTWLVVFPHALAVSIGTPAILTARIKDSAGNHSVATKVKWLTRDSAAAVIDSAGVVTGMTKGYATIVGVREGETDSALVQIVDPILVGAGDIASCNSSGDEATAMLLDSIPGTIFAAGDVVYPLGAPQYFTACYEPSWGRHKNRTRPAVGNHEYYYAPDARGYFAYFGERAGDPPRGYYSYDLGSWHIIVLNSNIASNPGSPQEQWLRTDLGTHPAVCTVAYWHHPLFTSGGEGPSPWMGPLAQALYDSGADVVITGHDHDYERFAPQTPAGVLDSARGIRVFVVGTGGASLLPFGTKVAANSEVRNNTSFGVLKLVLRAGAYDWVFIPVRGKSFTDSGSGHCH